MGRHREPLEPRLRRLSERMREHATEHGGVITASACDRYGADPAVVRRLIGAGEWCRVRRGVYRTAGGVPPAASARAAQRAEHHVRCAGLLAVLGPGAVVSHTSAARLLGLPLPPGAADEVTVTRRPPGRGGRLGVASRLHIARFADREVRSVHGVPVLTGARLVLDCCSVLDPPSGLAIADAALRRNLITAPELAAELGRRRGRPGARAAAVIIARADRLAGSRDESISRWWLLEAGLPPPVLQHPFTDDRGVVRATVGFWFPRQRVVGEVDDWPRHPEPARLRAAARRQEWLRDRHRVEVVRWSVAELADPAGRAALVDRFRRAVTRQEGGVQ